MSLNGNDDIADPCNTGVRKRATLDVLHTDKEVARVSTTGKWIVSGDVRGLRLIVTARVRRTADGGEFVELLKTFRLQYRTKTGIVRHQTIGAYGVDGCSLKSARADAEAIRTKVRQGGDPFAERVAARRAVQAARIGGDGSVLDLAKRCLASLDLRPATRENWSGVIRREIEGSAFGRRLATSLSRADIVEWVDGIRLPPRGASGQAQIAFVFLRRVFSWAVQRGVIPATPFGAGLKFPTAARVSDRVLSPLELRWLVRACRALGHAEAQVVLLLLLTGVRRRNVLEIERVDIEGVGDTLAPGPDAWAGSFGTPQFFVPLEKSKTGRRPGARQHIVPLSRQAAELIAARLPFVRNGYLFPTTDAAEGSFYTRLSSARVRQIKAKMVEIRNAEAAAAARPIPDHPIPDWHVHNLRHTIATQMRERLKVDGGVAALILQHKTAAATAITAIYDRALLIDERREALQRWADWLDEIAK